MLKKIYNFTENSSLMRVNCRKFLLITLDTFIILFAIYATSRIQENNVFNNGVNVAAVVATIVIPNVVDTVFKLGR